MQAMHPQLKKIGGRPRADRCTQTNRDIETKHTHLVSELNSRIRKQHSNNDQAHQDAMSTNNTDTQVPKSIPTTPMDQNHAHTPTPQAPPHQIDNDTATHTHSTQTSSPSQRVAVDAKAAGESPHPAPPFHQEDHPPQHNPTTLNTGRKR
jgi:hypothetical protein